MMLAVLLLLFLTASSTSLLASEDLFERYTFVKAMSRCFGKESYISFLSEVSRAKRECNFLDYRNLAWRNLSSTSLSTFLETFRPRPFGNSPPYSNNNNNNNNFNNYNNNNNNNFNNYNNNNNFNNNNNNFNSYNNNNNFNTNNNNNNNNLNTNNNNNDNNFNSYNNLLNYNDVLNFFSQGLRKNSKLTVNPSDTGHPYVINNNRYGTNRDSRYIIIADNDPRRPDSGSYTYDSEYLSEAIYRVRSAILNFTCVLQRLDMIDSNYNINYRRVINTFIEENVLDYRLRQDLSDGINYCRDSLRCLPAISLPIPIELYRLLEFMKCEKRTRLASCFRQDLRQNLHLFDMSALPEDKGRRAYLENLMAVVMGTDILEGSELL